MSNKPHKLRQEFPMSMGKVHLDIGDGGVSFEVLDKGRGPTLKITSSHYGNNKQTTCIFTTVASLKELGQMLLDAADNEFTEEYVYPAKVYHRTENAQYESQAESVEDDSEKTE